MNENKESFIVRIIGETGKKLSKTLDRNEIKGLVSYIKSIDMKLFKTQELAINTISTNFAKKLSNMDRNHIDVHEVMKRQMGGDSTADIYRKIECSPDYLDTDSTEVYKKGDKSSFKEYEMFSNMYDNIQSKTGHINILLDSYYKNLSYGDDVFKWAIMQSRVVQQGVVNIMNIDIKKISSIQFYNFSIPYTASAHNIYNKISLYIEELSPSAILINPNRGYHMMFDTATSGNGSIFLSPPGGNNGIFKFITPVNIMDTITIKFQSPFSPIKFLPDRYNISISSSGTSALLTFSEDHNIIDSELVHITGFKTLNPSVDYKYMDLVNIENGHIVTFIDNQHLEITDLDISMASLDSSNISSCFVASRRLIIPITLEYPM